jgi:hypothetical protein
VVELVEITTAFAETNRAVPTLVEPVETTPPSVVELVETNRALPARVESVETRPSSVVEPVETTPPSVVELVETTSHNHAGRADETTRAVPTVGRLVETTIRPSGG